MKLALQLAYRNLKGAGLRTWLNVIVLSFAFVIIIFYNGLIDGWNEQAINDSIAWEIGHGQLINDKYDPLDPFTLEDGYGKFDEKAAENFVPILIRQASIYPDGRMLNVLLKGIKANQNTLELPTQKLLDSVATIPAIIGNRMASSANLSLGDEILIRWRDANGTFDAANLTIVDIFDSNVATIDNNHIWISIDQLWNMTELHDHATLLVSKEPSAIEAMAGWHFKSQESLLKTLSDIIETKKVSGSIMYLLLLGIGLLAIFDTQVLSIFRRQREIGTYIAMGMTPWQVVKLFTIEGSMYSLMATLLGSAYGIPLLLYIGKIGIGIPPASREMGVSIAERIFPVYGIGLVVVTIILVVMAATIVSFLPARKIAKMNPVDALKGKLQ